MNEGIRTGYYTRLKTTVDGERLAIWLWSLGLFPLARLIIVPSFERYKCL